MPLSEHEQRLLDQIERALYAEDPKFAQAVRARSPRVHYKRRMIKAAFGFFVGVCLLMAGVVSKIYPIGVLGFVVMLAAFMWGFSSWKRMSGGSTSSEPAAGPGKGGPGKGGPARRANRPRFMERMEERWRRRHEQDGP